MNATVLNELSNRIIGCAIKVHKALGPGYIEKIYAGALAHEFTKNKIRFSRELAIKVKYDDLYLGEQRLDFVVEDELVLEIKAVYELNNFHMAQTLSYLKAAGKRLGLILNFARTKLEIKRVVAGL
jgi:GxxExxY protein